MNNPDEPRESANQQPQEEPEELTSDYANAAFVAPTFFDLKIIFGESVSFGHGVDWHTSITIPWQQAKLLAYYLEGTVAAYEFDNGPITIPQSLLPPELPTPTVPETEKPTMWNFFKFMKERRQRLIDSLTVRGES